ncbi:MAG: hypothetical protein H6822_02260 [Planctomycetaceae bacterium]|nr:hypothetical protein [Planctomycetales bacterium]MCB9920974.1 hypothetical protein [Planctomycetaceae bacterium]
MNKSSHPGWIALVVVNALLWFMFAADPSAEADPRQPPTVPVNPAAQRAEMVRELTEIKQLLKEQNQLLQSGRVKVVVAE